MTRDRVVSGEKRDFFSGWHVECLWLHYHNSSKEPLRDDWSGSS